MRKVWLPLALLMLAPALGWAQTVGPLTLNVGSDLFSPQRVFQILALTTILSIAPSVLLMVTSFTRLVIVFSFLRSALGLQTTPPNAVMVSLALFLTAFIMQPTWQAAYTNGLKPYFDGQIKEQEAFDRTAAPVKRFMLANVREDDLNLFISFLPKADQAGVLMPKPGADAATIAKAVNAMPLQVLIPSFMISELRRAFEIGFLLFLPFLVIDLVVASILMSLGMMMLPPVTIALPFKIIFFVLVDGWHLLAGTLVESFRPAL